jgi:hypothetical protein
LLNGKALIYIGAFLFGYMVKSGIFTKVTFPRLAKVAIFTTNADAENEC